MAAMADLAEMAFFSAWKHNRSSALACRMASGWFRCVSSAVAPGGSEVQRFRKLSLDKLQDRTTPVNAAFFWCLAALKGFLVPYSSP